MFATTNTTAIICLIILLTSLGSAQYANVTSTKLTTRTTESCYTVMASTSVAGNLSTTTTTSHTDATFQLRWVSASNHDLVLTNLLDRHTSTPSIISIPAPVTVTDTHTTHVVSTLTEGFHNRSTTTHTRTETSIAFVPGITNTTTLVATTTTALNTMTSTLRTTSGFRDIEATKETCRPVLPVPAVARRDSPAVSDDGEVDTSNSTSPVPASGLVGIQAAAYPSAVSCIATVVTSTGYTTIIPANVTITKIGRAPTTVVDTITTLTNTHTQILNNATYTLTLLTTTTYTTSATILPITSTAYSTSTYTLSTTTSTFLGACRTQRILGPSILPNASFPASERGLILNNIMYNPNKVQLWTSFKLSSYDCCEACQTSDDCAFGAWDSYQRICYLQRMISGTCPAQNVTQGVYTEAGRNETAQFAFDAFNG